MNSSFCRESEAPQWLRAQLRAELCISHPVLVDLFVFQLRAGQIFRSRMMQCQCQAQVDQNQQCSAPGWDFPAALGWLQAHRKHQTKGRRC